MSEIKVTKVNTERARVEYLSVNANAPNNSATLRWIWISVQRGNSYCRHYDRPTAASLRRVQRAQLAMVKL